MKTLAWALLVSSFIATCLIASKETKKHPVTLVANLTWCLSSLALAIWVLA